MASEFDSDSETDGRRLRLRIVERDAAELTDDMHQLREQVIEGFTDLRGRNGDNGKIGEVRRNVEAINSRLWWALTFVLGCLGGIGAKVFMSGREVGRIETKIEQLQRDVEDLRSIAFERAKQ